MKLKSSLLDLNSLSYSIPKLHHCQGRLILNNSNTAASITDILSTVKIQEKFFACIFQSVTRAFQNTPVHQFLGSQSGDIVFQRLEKYIQYICYTAISHLDSRLYLFSQAVSGKLSYLQYLRNKQHQTLPKAEANHRSSF